MAEVALVPAPNVTDGFPFCSTDACPCYDGKRCRLLGFRPDGICEPAVRIIVSERDEAREGCARAARDELQMFANRITTERDEEKARADRAEQALAVVAAERDQLKALVATLNGTANNWLEEDAEES